MLSVGLIHQRGVTFFEVLISLVIFAIAIIGLLSLQLKGFSASLDLSQRAIVANMLQDFSTRVRSNSSVAAAYQGDFSQNQCRAPSVPCSDTVGTDAVECNASEQAAHDLWEMLCGLENGTGLSSRIIDWNVAARCLDVAGNCTAADALLQVHATWGRRSGANNGSLVGTVTMNVLGTGASAQDINADQMVLVFSPW